MMPRLTTGRRRRHHSGQASIEYLVVLAFSVMLLIRPFSFPNSPTQTEEPALKQLATAIKDYHKHYTFAMAIASIPDCIWSTNAGDYFDLSSFPDALSALVVAPTVSMDICIDLTNPAIPTPALTGVPSMDEIKNGVAGAITQIIEDKIKEAFEQFANPANLFDFSPGSLLGIL